MTLKLQQTNEVHASARSAESSFEPICEADPYPRYRPGTYEARCVGGQIYRDPRFRAWKCRLDFRTIGSEWPVSAFFHLGNAERPKAGRGSRFFRAFVIANGDPPRKKQPLSKEAFLGKIFRVRVDDTKKSASGQDYIDSEIYSTIKDIEARLWP